MKALLLLIAMIVCHAALADPAARPITVYYEERAPYQVRNADGVAGLTATPAALAFKAAEIDITWEASSISRQLVLLRRNAAPACVVGWFKTEERMKFARYTKPVYRDGPVVALVRPQFGFGPGQSVRDALASPGLRLLVRAKYSYGAYVDGLIRQVRPVLVASPLPNSQMTELLLADRADLMLTTEEEAAELLRHLGPKGNALQLRRFNDPLPGEPRYIACSAKVPADAFARLDAAITGK